MMSDVEAAAADAWEEKFREDLAADAAFEAGVLFKEVGTVTIILGLVLLWSYLR